MESKIRQKPAHYRRSNIHQLFLAKEEPLQSELPPRPSMLLDSIHDSRKRYANLVEERLRAPDGSPGLTMNDPNPQPRRTHAKTEDLDLNNPLSLHDEVRVHHLGDLSYLQLTLSRILGMSGLLVLSCVR